MAGETGLDMERWACMLVKDLSWDELQHALDLGEIRGITMGTGRAMLAVIQRHIDAEVNLVRNAQEQDANEAYLQAETEAEMEVAERIKTGVADLKLAIHELESGLIEQGLATAKNALARLPKVK